jgi:hypothetical protein
MTGIKVPRKEAIKAALKSALTLISNCVGIDQVLSFSQQYINQAKMKLN